MAPQDPDEPTPDEPKLVIDEDWKTQVQREKEQARAQAKSSAEGEASEAPTEAEPRRERETEPEATKSRAPEAENVPPPPPANFETLVAMLATQAMVALGHGPDPTSGEPEVRKEYARHAIDMLAMLEEKTRGNVTDEEAQMLSSTIHQLRMLFVEVAR